MKNYFLVLLKIILGVVCIVIFCIACLKVLLWLDERKAADMYATMNDASAEIYLRQRLQNELTRTNDARASIGIKNVFRSCLIDNEANNKRAKYWVYKFFAENAGGSIYEASLIVYPDYYNWEIHAFSEDSILRRCMK